MNIKQAKITGEYTPPLGPDYKKRKSHPKRKIDSRCDLLIAIYDSEFQEINIPTFS